jgi:hypothetical protein
VVGGGLSGLSSNIYAVAGPDMLARQSRDTGPHLRPPQSAGRGFYVIDPVTFKVVDHYPIGS